MSCPWLLATRPTAGFGATSPSARALPPNHVARGGQIWKPFDTLIGKSSDAVQMITTGIDAEKATGATLWIPWFASSLASAYAELGKFEDLALHWRSNDGCGDH
jgi:hypothetical protein